MRVSLLPTEFPVTNLAVERPNRLILGLLPMLSRDFNFGRSGSLEFGVEKPNVFHFDAGQVKISSDGVLCGFFVKSSDRKLPEIPNWNSFEAIAVRICSADRQSFLSLPATSHFPLISIVYRTPFSVSKTTRWRKDRR